MIELQIAGLPFRATRPILATSFVRAICSIPSFGIAEFAVNVCSFDTNKNTNKTDGCRGFSGVFSMGRENFSEKSEIELTRKLLLLFIFSGWCPWPEGA
jgi:hypothetical protein